MVNLKIINEYQNHINNNAERIFKENPNKFFLLEYKINKISERFYSHKSSLIRYLKKHKKFENNFGGPHYWIGKVSDLEEIISNGDKEKEVLKYIKKMEDAHKSTEKSNLRFN